jgi:hypothetical protein
MCLLTPQQETKCGPPSTSFSRAVRLCPSGARLRSARYARLRSASPRRGRGAGTKTIYRNTFTPPVGYPQDVTEAEANMKFQRLLVQGLGDRLKGGRMSSKSVPVVVRILSESDVIIKLGSPFGRIYYAHWRYGYFESLRGLKPTTWETLPPLAADARRLISDFDSGVRKKAFLGEMIGVPFKYHAA